MQQIAQVAVACGQLLAVLGHGGEVASQLLLQLQGFTIGRLRLVRFAQ